MSRAGGTVSVAVWVNDCRPRRPVAGCAPPTATSAERGGDRVTRTCPAGLGAAVTGDADTVVRE